MSQSTIVLYLHVHQPWRLRDYSVFDIAERSNYFANDAMSGSNEAVLRKVADKSYRPMNALLLRLLEKHDDFKLSLSITGTFLDQAELWAPDVIASFQALVATGRVEIVGETYEHSLAFFYSREEFERQVARHRQRIQSLFGVTPTAFRNTELAYNDELARWAESAGYQAILAEGWDPVLEWRSPNHLYRAAGTSSLGLLLKNYRLSDDIAFRFSNQAWSEWPLKAETFDSWANEATRDAPLINLFMDYETFGEHQWTETGVFAFFEAFIGRWHSQPDHSFATVSQAATSLTPVGEISMPDTVTWADTERDLTAWTGNAMQREALAYLYALEAPIMHSGDQQLISDWRRLTTSDHTYYMCTKWFRDGDVHAYFSPYDSPYDAFLYFLNAVRDLRYRAMHQPTSGGNDG